MMPHRRPAPCEYCDSWENCATRRSGAPVPGGCFSPRRRLDLGRVRAFLVRLRRAARLPAAPFEDMEAALLAHFAGAMERYSNILEFSFSARGAVASPYRFSYSFPAFGEGRARGEVASCRALVEPFGGDARRVADSVLGPASPPAVAQILFGVDAAAGACRLKIYLQFPPGMARDKLALLARVLPSRAPRRFADAIDRLHLLGVDFDGGGVTGCKLYYLRSGVPVAKLRRAFPRAALLGHLAERRNVAALDDVVLISRLGPDGVPEGPPVGEVDLGLRANGLGWDDVAGFYRRRAVGRPFDAFRRASLARRRWSATRLSIPVAGGSRMNLYYVLLDPP